MSQWLSRPTCCASAIEQFSQGDLEAALSNWSQDFTWEGGNSEDMPGGGTHEGKDAAISVLQQAVGAWDEFSLAADEFFEDGDTVVVLGHTDVKKGDQSATLTVVHIWRFRGDDEVCRLQMPHRHAVWRPSTGQSLTRPDSSISRHRDLTRSANVMSAGCACVNAARSWACAWVAVGELVDCMERGLWSWPVLMQ